MTIKKCIDMVEEIYPNEFDYDHQITWLNQLERELYEMLFPQYDYPLREFTGYDSDTPDETELLAPEMFSDIYVQWLLAKIYQAREETIKYNNTVEVYNSLLYDMKAYFSRTYGRKKHFRFKNYKV